MPLTPAERSRNARIAALTRWSREDPAIQAERMAAGVEAKFEREVDPDGALAPAERRRRAKAARQAHMLKLARLSVAKRNRAEPA